MSDANYIISIGDWSDDGHGYCKYFIYKASHSRSWQVDAYQKSCETTGLAFHERGYGDDDICVRWQDCWINSYQIELLRRYFNIDNSSFGDHGPNGFTPTPKEFAELILWFISKSLPGFKHSPLTEIPKAALGDTKDGTKLNGFWSSDDLNVQFGYGLLDRPPAYTDDCLRRRALPEKGKVVRGSRYTDAIRFGFDYEERSVPPLHIWRDRDDWKPFRRLQQARFKGSVICVERRAFFDNKKDIDTYFSKVEEIFYRRADIETMLASPISLSEFSFGKLNPEWALRNFVAEKLKREFSPLDAEVAKSIYHGMSSHDYYDKDRVDAALIFYDHRTKQICFRDAADGVIFRMFGQTYIERALNQKAEGIIK